jgi:hypothetical protein
MVGEPIFDLVSVVVLMVLRLAVPLGLTLGFGQLLRRLVPTAS